MLKILAMLAAMAAIIMIGVIAGPTANAASPTTVHLGTARDFAVLAGTKISNIPTSAITGDVGLKPASGSSITGLTCAEVTGTVYKVDATGKACYTTNAGLLTTAKNNLTTAYGDAAGRSPDDTFLAADNQLGGQTLIPGVYRFGHASTANLIGNLTLNGGANAVWIFQATSDLVTASSSTVTLTGGARSCNVFWQVSSSATLGTSSKIRGTIMALTSITVTTGVTVRGRVLARNGAVTLDRDTITKPQSCARVVATPTPTLPGGATPTPTLAGGPTPTSAPPDTATEATVDQWPPQSIAVAVGLLLMSVGGFLFIATRRRHALGR